MNALLLFGLVYRPPSIMTHITGPRKEKVDELTGWIMETIEISGCTISECQEALHEADTALLKAALRPLERFTCPACPTESLTPEKIKRIEDAIAAVLGGER